jgi:probable rRNA maturation factor
LNRSYQGHDYETDVISFVLESDPEQQYLTGQLVVSLDTAASVAEELGIPIEHELLLYVIHGSLHLVGFDDQEPVRALKMRAAEQDFLGRLGIAHHWPQTDATRPIASHHEAE